MLQATREAFVSLDMELTGKPLRQCQQNAYHQRKQDIYDLQSNLYYLSDSGYSRIRIADDFTAHLAQGARAEVEFNWQYADHAIKSLNDALTQEACSNCDDDGLVDSVSDPLGQSDCYVHRVTCAVDGCGFYANDLSDYCPLHG